MVKKLERGFITALGTPRDKDGYLIEESLSRHVIDQINGGVHGFLALGGMGNGHIVACWMVENNW
jgi:dihydrodipicolinate synthase/N-acetylneuraminate lyase